MVKGFINTIFLTLICISSFSQVIVTTPAYPSDNDSCTIIFDASKGNGELKDVPPPIYAHTGVITNLSSSPTDWKHVIAGWSENTPKALMTPLGNNLYKLRITPSIRSFYNVPSNEEILKMAFVFRNADGTKVGRESSGGDIYADVYPEGMSVNITQPSTDHILAKQGTSIIVRAVSPMADSLFLFLNNTLLKKVAGISISDTLAANDLGAVWEEQLIIVKASNDTASAADTVVCQVIPSPVTEDLPAGIRDGINYIDSTTVVLSLFAPYKEYVFATGDFNDWKIDSSHYMKRTSQGNRYWIRIENLIPRKEYIFQYMIDGKLKIADPYAEKISDPNDKYIPSSTYPDLIPYPEAKTTQIASVFQTAQTPYAWGTTSFSPPKTTDLVIYELLLRDFIGKHDYQTLEDTIQYLKRLNINAIELMPVMEFEGNESWGYNPDFMFAPDKYYGPPSNLKHFIEKAHSLGIAVILDIVVNHQFGQSPLVRLYWDDANNRPLPLSPWFNPVPKHPYNVGYDFNHESSFTKEYFNRVFRYWIEEYHIDGFRFDLSKGLTQKNTYPDDVSGWSKYDASRISILKGYNDTIKSIKPDFILILEHFADNDEEQVLSNAGMLLWGNMNYAYSQAGMGYSQGSDFSSVSYKKRNWNNPYLIGYMESHDEERSMYKILTWGNSTVWYNTREKGFALEREAMNAAFFYTVPGPKMLWQFGERGYDKSIDSYGGRLAPKPPLWDYMEDWQRKRLYNTVSSLIDLRIREDAFETSDFDISASGYDKKIHLRSPSMNVTIAGNFDVNPMNLVPAFTNTGTWYDYFSGDSLIVSDVNQVMEYLPGEYHIYTTKKLQRPVFVGIDEISGLQNETLIIFPNPAENFINIITDKELKEIRVIDMTGRLCGIYSGSSKRIYLGKYAPGSYILEAITMKGSQMNARLLKK